MNDLIANATRTGNCLSLRLSVMNKKIILYGVLAPFERQEFGLLLCFLNVRDSNVLAILSCDSSCYLMYLLRFALTTGVLSFKIGSLKKYYFKVLDTTPGAGLRALFHMAASAPVAVSVQECTIC